MIVTIDGPAGAGKSTAARTLAKRLGYRFLDTGAMYRAVTLAVMRADLDWNEPQKLAELTRSLRIELQGDRVLLDGEDVTESIRTHEITLLSHHAAGNSSVREHLVELQRCAAGDDDIVTEGRDQGTVVFPSAECKIFLTAGAKERAQRRWLDLQERGEQVTFEEVLAKQNLRDERDISRAVGPLVAAADAIHIRTDGLTPDAVLARLVEAVLARAASVGRSIDPPSG